MYVQKGGNEGEMGEAVEQVMRRRQTHAMTGLPRAGPAWQIPRGRQCLGPTAIAYMATHPLTCIGLQQNIYPPTCLVGEGKSLVPTHSSLIIYPFFLFYKISLPRFS